MAEMQMVLIVCDAGVTARVTEIINEAGAPGYTVLHDATGKGESGPRENTPIWPGLNSVILCAVPTDRVPDIREGLDALRKQRSARHLPLKMFVWALEEVH
ncbi:MAG: PG0541 family transporter-associated protein [Armatimonadota bacterium]